MTLDLNLRVSVSEKGEIQAISLLEGKKGNGLTASFLRFESLALLDWLKQYGLQQEPSISLALSLASLPPFTQKVLRYLQKIPFGQTLSYSSIAQALGNPKAARAVGNACRQNPLPLIIPCHRVIEVSGKLGGFAYGLPLKQKLLEYEQGLLIKKIL